jgi:fucose permease
MNWSAIIVAYLSLFVNGLVDNSRGPAYPEILRHFQIGPSLGGLFFALSSLAGLSTNLASRYWLFRFSRLTAMRLCLWLQALSCIGLGCAGIISDGFSLLLISAILFGMGNGGLGTTLNLTVADASPPAIRRKTLSGLHAMYGFASLFAPLLFATAFHHHIAWPSYFTGLTALPLALIAWSYRPGLPNGAPPNERLLAPSLPWAKRLPTGAIFALAVGAELSISCQLVFYIEEVYTWDKQRAASYLSLFFLFLLSGRLLFALKKFPWTSQTWLLLSSGISCCLFLIGLASHPFFLALCGLSISIFFPCGMDWVSQRFPQQIGIMTASIMIMIGSTLVLMHFMLGILADIIGIRLALLMGPLFLVGCFGLLLIERQRQSAQSQ